jgi:hypothetical protein
MEAPYTAVGVSPYSLPSGVPLPELPVVVNLSAIPTEKSLVRVPATVEIPIAEATFTMGTQMEIMMKTFTAWTLQMGKANESRYGGYQTARVYAIQACHPSWHTPMGPNCQPHQHQEVGPIISCGDVEYIHAFCPDECTDRDNGIVPLNVTTIPRGGIAGEIS